MFTHLVRNVIFSRHHSHIEKGKMECYVFHVIAFMLSLKFVLIS